MTDTTVEDYIEVLQQVDALLSQESAWIKDSDASHRFADGSRTTKPVSPSSKNANCWDISGAIERIALRERLGSMADLFELLRSYASSDDFQKGHDYPWKQRVLFGEIVNRHEFLSIYGFNDRPETTYLHMRSLIAYSLEKLKS